MTALARSFSAIAPAPAADADLRLQCPQCGTFLGILRADQFPREFLYSCTGCYFQMLNESGIWKALPPTRAAHYAKFMREYQVVREAEGRGSKNSAYYAALPYRDLSGRNQEQWAIRARTYSFLERRILPEIENRNAGRLNILDLGAGNGWLSFRLALRGHGPVAVDLLDAEMDGLGAAAHYIHKLPSLFPRFQAELDHLPLANSQFDVAIFNASFHYSENYSQTLAEAIRCLRRGGTVIIADTSWYKREESGQRMLAERRKTFVERYGFPSDGLDSLEYLTDSRMAALEDEFHLRWRAYSPFYGVRWALRPLVARLQRKREPSRFRIYAAEVVK